MKEKEVVEEKCNKSTKGFIWANSTFLALAMLVPKILSLPSETPWWRISGQIKFFLLISALIFGRK